MTYLDQVDLTLSAESFDELDVLRLSATFVEHTEMGLTLVEGLGGLSQTSSKTVNDQRTLENLLESVFNGPVVDWNEKFRRKKKKKSQFPCSASHASLDAGAPLEYHVECEPTSFPWVPQLQQLRPPPQRSQRRVIPLQSQT